MVHLVVVYKLQQLYWYFASGQEQDGVQEKDGEESVQVLEVVVLLGDALVE